MIEKMFDVSCDDVKIGDIISNSLFGLSKDIPEKESQESMLISHGIF